MRQTRRNIRVLFTCIGRRVSLLNSFRKAAKSLGIKARFLGTDMTELSAALQLCDDKIIMNRIDEPGYIPQLLRIAKRHRVDLIIPTIDTDLPALAENRQKFERAGCRVLISSSEVVKTTRDKRKLHQFLLRNGFGTPETMTLKEALRRNRLSMPRVLKPWDGSASKSNHIVRDRQEMRYIGRRVHNCIVQEFIDGQEYTCDVYVDFDMKVRCVVPRKRLETRGGEVTKSKVEKNPVIMDVARRATEALGAGPGMLNIQLFLCSNGSVKIIEINPRFGGGAPLGIQAGADSPKWILQEMSGIKPRIQPDGFRDGLYMLRWDSEVWLG
ncbi:MAG TPA: ATP-grasp domain-containing protein [Sedimentisphaerales bacterium]|nr:ATP-grasp domain-containing protein [Sedimentisphaerales bacterium]